MNIVAVRGNGVVVERAENGHTEQAGVKTKFTGDRNNERHYH